MRRMLTVALGTIAAVLLLVVVLFGRAHSDAIKQPAQLTLPAPAGRAPAATFTATTINGDKVGLSSFRGKPLVINFFAAWCDPCRREAAAFVQLDHRFAGRVNLLSVAVRTPQLSSVRGFVHDHDMSWPVVWDEHGHLIDPYHVLGQPITYIIDAQGRVVYRIIGQTTEQRVGGVLDRLLA
ncbi:MAG TPA: TlpA disulfide reductase family protein [Gaiellales bacterium]|nr:TlpA disulfide reductase family protein [Gaiellales bacterium]